MEYIESYLQNLQMSQVRMLWVLMIQHQQRIQQERGYMMLRQLMQKFRLDSQYKPPLLHLDYMFLLDSRCNWLRLSSENTFQLDK